MNGRFFLSALSAAAAAPALPAIAMPAAPHHLKVASIIARAHNRCTPEMLVRHLKVTPEVAGNIQAQLVRQGVITAPVSGVSLATNPGNSHCITNEALKPNNILHKAARLREKLAELDLQPTPPPDEVSDHADDIRIDNRLNNPSTS